MANSGWGEAVFLRHVWPGARIGVCAEYFYRAEGADIGFDAEFDGVEEFGRPARVEMRNLPLRLQLEAADAGMSPTRLQAEAHPPDLRGKLSVIFDGVDTDAIRPDPAARLTLPDGTPLGPADEVVSWSLMEAMSAQGAIVACDTGPVHELLADGEAGLLGDFFDGAGMVERICRLIDDAALRDRLGRAARTRVAARYDPRRVCLPAQFDRIGRPAGAAP